MRGGTRLARIDIVYLFLSNDSLSVHSNHVLVTLGTCIFRLVRGNIGVPVDRAISTAVLQSGHVDDSLGTLGL